VFSIEPLLEWADREGVEVPEVDDEQGR